MHRGYMLRLPFQRRRRSDSAANHSVVQIDPRADRDCASSETLVTSDASHTSSPRPRPVISKASSSFLKKRTKKTFVPFWRALQKSPRQQDQKFFATFFKKAGLALLDFERSRVRAVGIRTRPSPPHRPTVHSPVGVRSNVSPAVSHCTPLQRRRNQASEEASRQHKRKFCLSLKIGSCRIGER